MCDCFGVICLVNVEFVTALLVFLDFVLCTFWVILDYSWWACCTGLFCCRLTALLVWFALPCFAVGCLIDVFILGLCWMYLFDFV